MIVQLMWKECREHVWKMLAIGAILFLICRSIESFTVWSREDVWLWGTWLTPIWLAAFTLSVEKTRGTETTLTALPVSPWAVYAIRTFWGIASFVVPLALILWLMNPAQSAREIDVAFLFGSVTMYALILCVGMGIKREGLAAMMGLLILVGSACWTAGVSQMLIREPREPGAWLMWLNVPNPFCLALVMANRSGVKGMAYGAIAAQAVVTAVYWWVGGWRYGGQAGRRSRENRADAAPVGNVHWVSKKAFGRGALLWKESREQRGILLATVILGGLLALWMGIARRGVGHDLPSWLPAVHDTLTMLFAIGTYVPSVVAAVLGISAMAGDLDENLAAFWQSRPIAPQRLFWAKYGVALVGLVILQVLFEAPYLLALLLRFHPTIEGSVVLGFSPLDIVMGQAIWLPFMLSFAMFMAALFRRTIYAAGMILVIAGIVLMVPVVKDESVGNILFDGNLRLCVPTVLAMAALGVVLTFLARVAFERRWRIG